MPMYLTGSTLIGEVGSSIPTVLGWVGEVITAVTTGELAPLLPLWAIGIGISGIMLGVKVMRSFTWGN